MRTKTVHEPIHPPAAGNPMFRQFSVTDRKFGSGRSWISGAGCLVFLVAAAAAAGHKTRYERRLKRTASVRASLREESAAWGHYRPAVTRPSVRRLAYGRLSRRLSHGRLSRRLAYGCPRWQVVTCCCQAVTRPSVRDPQYGWPAPRVAGCSSTGGDGSSPRRSTHQAFSALLANGRRSRPHSMSS